MSPIALRAWKKLKAGAAHFERAHRVCLAVGFLFVVAHLFLLSHADIRVLLLFLFPPLFAIFVANRPDASSMLLVLAYAFLMLIGVGVIAGCDPRLLPKMNEFPQLPPFEGRILTFYLAVYLLFLWVILPPCIFGRELWRRRCEKPTQFSRMTSYLGLFTWGLLMLGLTQAIPRLIERYS